SQRRLHRESNELQWRAGHLNSTQLTPWESSLCSFVPSLNESAELGIFSHEGSLLLFLRLTDGRLDHEFFIVAVEVSTHESLALGDIGDHKLPLGKSSACLVQRSCRHPIGPRIERFIRFQLEFLEQEWISDAPCNLIRE